jgi:catechol 2,3-dioxygenase-like lactoylglutathione lyase family enzyme
MPILCPLDVRVYPLHERRRPWGSDTDQNNSQPIESAERPLSSCSCPSSEQAAEPRPDRAKRAAALTHEQRGADLRPSAERGTAEPTGDALAPRGRSPGTTPPRVPLRDGQLDECFHVEKLRLAPLTRVKGHDRRGAHDPRRPMTIQRMDNVLIVVDDLEAAKAFFAELGMELEGEATNEGPWVDRVVGLSDVRADIAMMRTPDGHGRLELSKFHTPPAVRAEPESAPANALGIRRIMFAVDDIDDVVARLRSHGAELVGEIAQYEDSYRLCFLRGPEGIIIGLAEQLS